MNKRDYIHCGTLYCRYRTPYCLRGLRQYFQWGNQGKGMVDEWLDEVWGKGLFLCPILPAVFLRTCV